MRAFVTLSLGVTLLFVSSVTPFYIPGFHPQSFCLGGKTDKSDACLSGVRVFANRVASPHTVLPYRFSDFGLCNPEDAESDKSRYLHPSLSQILSGSRLEATNVTFDFDKTQECIHVCTKKFKYRADVDFVAKAILQEYKYEFEVDHLPAMYCLKDSKSSADYCTTQIPVGCMRRSEDNDVDVDNMVAHKECAFLNSQVTGSNDDIFMVNHFDITVHYHKFEEGHARIVRVDMTPSITDENCRPSVTSGALQTRGTQNPIDFTVTVRFRENTSLKWSSRWDHVIAATATANDIRWISILNCIVVVSFMAILVSTTLARTISRDITRYNSTSVDDIQEEFGWKLVHGDVFRPPNRSILLSCLLGNGVQLCIASQATLFLAALGLVSPANRGSILTAAIVIFLLLGVVAGYVSSRVYKQWGGLKWYSNIAYTALFCPGFAFVIFFIFNLVLWIEGSSAAMPFWVIVVLLVLWFFVQAPLVLVGAFVGFRRPIVDPPLRTNQIPRQIPPQPLQARPVASMTFGAAMTFGLSYIQLYFVLGSIWGHHIYFMFSLLFVVFLMMLVTTVLVCVLFCYVQLCNENYQWHWRAFINGGSSALALFAYSIYYFVVHADMTGFISVVLYFGYSFMLTAMMWVIGGAAGYFACSRFVRHIYSSIKFD